MVRSIHRCALGALVMLGGLGVASTAQAEDAAADKSVKCGPPQDPFMHRVQSSFSKVKGKAKPAVAAKPPPMVLAKFEAPAAEEPASATSDSGAPQGGIARVADPAEPEPAEEESAAPEVQPGDEPPVEATVLPGEEPAIDPAAAQAPAAEAAEEASAAEAKKTASAPAPAPAPSAEAPEEPTATTVTGSIVLGLLPYTVAGGAFGLGTSVGVDNFSKDAGVVFGPSASLGVTDWFTLGAAIPFASAPVEDERVTGLGNVGVSAQFMFFQDEDLGLALAATPGVALPSPAASASTSVVPDLKASGAVNFGAVALNLTARGSLDVPTEGSDEAAPAFDSALSLILVNDTWAPFLEAAVAVSDSVVPIGAAGLNFAPGGGALLTAGIPVAFDGDTVKPGMSFTAYFETELWGGSKSVAKVSATPYVGSRSNSTRVPRMRISRGGAPVRSNSTHAPPTKDLARVERSRSERFEAGVFARLSAHGAPKARPPRLPA